MIKKGVLAVILIFFLEEIAYSENSKIADILKKDFKYIAKTGFKRENIKYIAGFGFFLLGSFLSDNGIHVEKHEDTAPKKISDVTNNFGDKRILFPSTLSLALLGKLTKNKKLFEASLTAFESLIISGLLCSGIQFIVGRKRPCETGYVLKFKPFRGLFRWKYSSFPSGHVTDAWAAFTPYAIYYHQPLLYLIPLSVNFARVIKNKHWFSDTVMGAGIGFSIGYLLSKSHLSQFNISKNWKISLTPCSISIVYNLPNL